MATTQARSAAGIRERNRIELTNEILASATEHLIKHGAAALSLRAITRDLGMASSAIYRYFASRDELLTALIMRSFDDLGESLEHASETTRTIPLDEQWLALARSMRNWATTNPQRWALIYGTPITGYVAPQDTIASANRATAPLLDLMARREGCAKVAPTKDPSPQVLHEDMRPFVTASGVELPEQAMIESLGAWAKLLGLISLELFGHFENVVTRHAEHFDVQVRLLAVELKLGNAVASAS